jgi:hypothetical protein
LRRKSLPPDKQVDCPCPGSMARAVYIHAAHWAACVGCGAMSVTEAIVDEPRPHDVQCLGHEVVAFDEKVMRWLGAWALRAGPPWGGSEWLFLPSRLRLSTERELVEAERRARDEQARLTRIERLRRSGVPSDPAPAELPPQLSLYRDALEATRYQVPDLRSLLAFASRSLHGLALFEDQIRGHPELVSAIEDAMIDPALSAFAFELARRFTLCSPRILQVLGEAIARIATQTREANSALYLAGGLGRAASSLVPALEAAAARVDRNDYYFHKQIVDTAARCRLGAK